MTTEISDQIDCLQAYPLVHRVFDGNPEPVEQRTCIYVTVHKECPEDPKKTVFAIGESLCHLNDNFNKAKGLAIAKGRAEKLKTGECEFAKTFTLEAAVTTFEAEQLNMKFSSVGTPQTEAPLPYGIVNRLKNLVSYDVPEELYAEWNKQSA